MITSESPTVAPRPAPKVQLDGRTAEYLRRLDDRAAVLAECTAVADAIAKQWEAGYHQSRALTADHQVLITKSWAVAGAAQVAKALAERQLAAELLAKEMREAAEAGQWRVK